MIRIESDLQSKNLLSRILTKYIGRKSGGYVGGSEGDTSEEGGAEG